LKNVVWVAIEVSSAAPNPSTFRPCANWLAVLQIIFIAPKIPSIRDERMGNRVVAGNSPEPSLSLLHAQIVASLFPW
jgi:hypothetical protein